MSDSFLRLLIESFESRADKTAMRIVGNDDEVYTFSEMLKRIRSVAHRLGEENIEFGDRVALIGENHPSWAIAYLGTLYHGAVCVPMDPHGEIDTLANFIENSESKMAFLSPDQAERFAKIEEKIGRKIPAVVWAIGSASSTTADDTDFENWATTEFPESFAKELPKAADNDIALLIYTSGTTGTPKGVPLTHGNIVGEISGVNDVLTIGE